MSEKIKVVMIDDEEDLCLMVKCNLEEKGNYEVATLSDPKQAESFVKQEMPDIILLDVVMPERRGPDVVIALKKDNDLKRIPIVMVSGKGEMVYNKKKDDFKWIPNSQLVKERGELPDVKGAEALAEAYSVDDYISKPFATDLLIQVLEEVLKRTKKRAPEEKQDF